MLSSLKQFASGWIAQLLLGLLVLSFAVWGISDIFTGFRAGAVVTVGEKEVSLVDFQQRYRTSLQLLQRQTGRAITEEQAVQFGVPTQVLSTLVGEATLDDAGREMGLGISDEMLTRLITTDPNLVGASGVYSAAALRDFIRSNGMTEDQFVLNRRDEYTRRQITDALAGGVEVPEAYMRAVQEFRNEERSVVYVVTAADPFDQIPEPTEAELNPFFEDNKADWRAPEYRGFRYFVLSPTTVARPEEVDEAAISERYTQQNARFSTPEQRRLDQIVFDSAEEAEAAAGALASGKTFDELVADNGLTSADVDFGTYAKAELLEEAVAEAAFELGLNETSAVVEGRFGPLILRVAEITEGTVQALDEVRETLRAEIANERAAAEVDDMHDAIEDARAGGANLAEVAARFGLDIVEIAAADAAGQDEDGAALTDLPSPIVISSVFESDVGLENDPIRPDRASFLWYEVTAVTAARDRTLAEVRDRVVTAWKDAERAAQAQTVADAIKERVDGGEPLTDVAEEMGLAVQKAEGLNRASQPTGDLTADAVNAAFGGPQGTTAVTAGSDPLTRIVLSVDAVDTPAFFSGAPDLESTQVAFSRQIAGDLMQLYVGEVQDDRDVRFNQQALDLIFSTPGASVNPATGQPHGM